jgi:hypothetical protein
MSFSRELFLFPRTLACVFDLYVLGHWLRERDAEKQFPHARRVNPKGETAESKKTGKQAGSRRESS